jgi:hypothetical protein
VSQQRTARDARLPEIEIVPGTYGTALKAKRARAAAGLRTSAAHARWEEFEIGDVIPVIEFTKELIAAHLG